MELEEQGRGDFVVQFRIFVGRSHLRLVEQLDASDRNAILDRQDDGIDSILNSRESANRGRNRLRNAVKSNRHLGNDTERTFRADKKAGQIVSGRRLASPAG